MTDQDDKAPQADRDEDEGDGTPAPSDPLGPMPEAPKDDGPALLRAGNPVRYRALLPIGLGAVPTLLVMASPAAPRVVVPVSLIGIGLVVFGLLDLVGSFDDGDEHVAGRARARAVAAPLATLLAGLLAQLVLLRLAVLGRLPAMGSVLGMPLAFLASVLGAYWAGRRLGMGDGRPLWRRHGFWLVLIATLVYLPMLGNHSLSDPWETHYGEVAREILARNDWISLWWAQDGWFWSKPVLTFWIQAVPMALFGVRYEPGAMLSAVAQGRTPQPEWAVRMPIFLLTVLALYLLYKAVARSHGRRAGLLGALVLLSMPQWFLLSHQTMTDMPFVAPMAAGIALFLLGIHSDPEQRVGVYELGLGRWRLRLSLYHLVLGAILLVIVPQVLYLLSRNVSLAFEPQLRLWFHADVFTSGSPHNCGLPGNQACREGLRPVVKSFQPAVQALVWIQAVALLLWMSWGERRRQRLLFLAAWLMLSLSTMAKGPAGIGLPVLAALAYVLFTKRWRDLSRMEIVAGLLIFAATVLPWFVAMYCRHGQPFSDRLLFHDMFKRAFKHVHDTNKGADLSFRYYVWQLGYAAFPWSGLVPVALVQWLRRRQPPRHPAAATSAMLLAWFVVGFVLFALMGTKFHHYCFPIVPPMALLTGVLLDDLLRSSERGGRADGSPSSGAPGGRQALLGAVAVGAALLTLFVGRDLAWKAQGRLADIRLMHLFTYNYGRPWPESLSFTAELWAYTFAAAAITLLLLFRPIRQRVVVALTAVALVFAAWGVDVYLVKLSPHWGQRELFVRYEHERMAQPGPCVAYQLNWKGENFYRGNEVPAFVSSGNKFKKWVDEQKEQGVTVLYFVTEHGRTGSLSNELGSPPTFEKLTTKELNNKFVLVRARFEPGA